MIRLILIIGLVTTILSTGFVVYSQEISDPIQSPTITFEQLQSDYLFQLDQYRKAEERFSLDKAEFYKVQTLTSREKSVASMRPYLESRARVLSTYLVALQFLLNQAQGVDLTAKNNTIIKLEEAKLYLKQHIDKVPSLVDRTAVNTAAEQFEFQGLPLIEEAQYRTLTLLATGRVQRSYDQLDLATLEFQTNYIDQIPNEALKERIERGMEDVYFQNEKATTSLSAVIRNYPRLYTPEEYAELTRKPSYITIYSNTISELQKSYSAMKQSIKFLKELERQI